MTRKAAKTFGNRTCPGRQDDPLTDRRKSFPYINSLQFDFIPGDLKLFF